MTVQENPGDGCFPAVIPRGIKADTERVLMLFPRLRERIVKKRGRSGGEQQMLHDRSAPRLPLLLDEPAWALAPTDPSFNYSRH